MISSRGPENIIVIDRNQVPVDEVCEAVADHKTMEWIKRKYPITDEEIFQCLEAFIDMTLPVRGDVLELKLLASSSNARMFDMKTEAISDRVYFAILSYARVLAPQCLDVHLLYRIGIESILVECFMDIKSGTFDPTTADGLYQIVFEAFKKIYDSVEDNIDTLLEQFSKEHKAHLEAVKRTKNKVQ